MFGGLDQGGVETVLLNHHPLDTLILSGPHTWEACVVQSKVERVGAAAVGKTHLNIHKWLMIESYKVRFWGHLSWFSNFEHEAIMVKTQIKTCTDGNKWKIGKCNQTLGIKIKGCKTGKRTKCTVINKMLVNTYEFDWVSYIVLLRGCAEQTLPTQCILKTSKQLFFDVLYKLPMSLHIVKLGSVSWSVVLSKFKIHGQKRTRSDNPNVPPPPTENFSTSI